MNEKSIQQVLEIEKQADEIYEKAIHDAEQLPIQAELEAQTLVEKARTEAEEEARKLVADARADEESAKILSETEETVKRTDAVAANNFNKAVAYVLDRVIGREK